MFDYIIRFMWFVYWISLWDGEFRIMNKLELNRVTGSVVDAVVLARLALRPPWL